MSPPSRIDRGWIAIIDRLQAWQSRLGKVYGRPTSGMRTDFSIGNRPVIFLHNPKTGGRSLRMLLGVRRLSHTPPCQRLNARNWVDSYSIVAVRDPFERFLSGYFDHVLKRKENALTRMYGPALFGIGPFDYLQILHDNPKFGGPQRQWSDFPDARKPRADLILRFEQIGDWCRQIEAAGIALEGRTLPHRNSSARAEADHLQALRLSADAYHRLETEVRDYFREDAQAFGYPTVPVTPDLPISVACSA